MPSWLRGVGVEGGEINLVPVDYVAKAMDHIAHQPDLDGQAFHLTDPEPLTVGGLFKALTKAAKAPQPSVNLDARALDALPARLTTTLTHLPGAKQLTDLALAELGIPRESFAYLTYPTHFDSTKTQAALADSGIEVPPFATYAQHALGVLGAQLQPGPPQGQAARARHPRQGRHDHRRVVGHRPGHRAARRRGRRQGHPRRPRGRQARADQASRSRTSAARPTSTAATCPT